MFPDLTTKCRTSAGCRGSLPFWVLMERAAGRVAAVLLLLALHGRILTSAVAFADRLSLLQRFLLGTVKGLLGLAGLFLNLARLGKTLLRFIILTRRGFISFTFVR